MDKYRVTRTYVVTEVMDVDAESKEAAKEHAEMQDDSAYWDEVEVSAYEYSDPVLVSSLS